MSADVQVQKRTLDVLVLESQSFVSCLMWVLRPKLGPSAREAHALKLSHSFTLKRDLIHP